MIFQGDINAYDIDQQLTSSDVGRLVLDLTVQRYTVDVKSATNAHELSFELIIGDYIKGEGVVRGGDKGDVLVKNSGEDFDTEWKNLTAKIMTTKATGVEMTQEQFNKDVILEIIRDVHKDDWYGVEITNLPATALPRIGKLDLHRTLPIHNKMRRCLLNVDGTVNYYTHPDNTALKEDGSPAILDGRDGDVMVDIPFHYRKIEPKGEGFLVKVSEYPLEGFLPVRVTMPSAYEASIDRTPPTKKYTS